MNHAEFLSIQGQLQDHFDSRYVQIAECEKTVDKEEKKIDQLTVEFAKKQHKVKHFDRHFVHNRCSHCRSLRKTAIWRLTDIKFCDKIFVGRFLSPHDFLKVRFLYGKLR